jgi:hypothetical protein
VLSPETGNSRRTVGSIYTFSLPVVLIVVGIGNLQHDMGSTQHHQNPNSAARAQGYNEGDQGQFGGMKDSTLGAVTGDRQQQTRGW